MSSDCLELFARRKRASSFISIAIWAGGISGDYAALEFYGHD